MSLEQKIRTTLRLLTTQYYRLTSPQLYTSLNNNINAGTKWGMGKIGVKIIIAVLLVFGLIFGFNRGLPNMSDYDLNKIGSKSYSSVSSENEMIDVLSHYESQGLLNITTTPHFIDSDSATDLKLIDFDRSHAKYISPELIQSIYKSTDLSQVDWTRYAYVLYATSPAHLCNSFMIFASLRQYGSKADMVLILNEDFLNTEGETGVKYAAEYKELMRQKNLLKLTYRPVSVVTKSDVDPEKIIWISSFTKLLVFGETQYDRIIYMDADAVLTKTHLDELFFIPPCKLASPSGYWLTQEIFNREHGSIMEKYPPEKYDWKPKTVQERAKEIWQYTKNFINPFINHDTGKLPRVINDAANGNITTTVQDAVNVKNYQNTLYNNLPNYHTLDEFLLTNIIMVIQPDEQLYQKVKQGIEERSHNEFDMDIIQRLFHLPKTIFNQKASFKAESLTFAERLEEIPEFIILPATAYGALSGEFNVPGDHTYFAADPVDQLWATHSTIKDPLKNKLENDNSLQPPYFFIEDLTQVPGEYLNRNLKYLHFSDAPIPKPWFYFDPKNGYMGHRSRCPTFREFVFVKEYEGMVKPNGRVADCSAAEVWEYARNLFEKLRLDVCGLGLIRADRDTYYEIIN